MQPARPAVFTQLRGKKTKARLVVQLTDDIPGWGPKGEHSKDYLPLVVNEASSGLITIQPMQQATSSGFLENSCAWCGTPAAR